jgi:hypothetical protein
MRLALPFVALVAFLVGCATAPTPPATSAPPSVLAGFACPIDQAVIGFDPLGTPVCGAPWVTPPEPTPTPTPTPTPSTPPTVTPSPLPERFSLSQDSCSAAAFARFTIVSISGGYAVSRLAVRDATNGKTLAVASDGDSYAKAGDTLTMSGPLECTDTLHFVDTPNNAVMATITLHP